MVETLQTCFQHRALLRAGPRLNARAVGILARAQKLYDVSIHGFVVMSTHFHVAATYRDPEQMARFHCHVNGNLSKEAGLLRDWPESVFPRRYRHVEVSDEAQVQWQRMKYLLSHGCKEGLVASPLDWPGASSAWSLASGEPCVGEWVDRTALRRALERGEAVSEADFTQVLELELSPVPCFAHLPAEAYRHEIRSLIRVIEQETAARHQVDGSRPAGVDRVLARPPHHRPQDIPKRPRPWFHASDPAIRKKIKDALVFIAVSYGVASKELRQGNRNASFPVHTFPPGLPFVRDRGGADGTSKDGTSPKGLAPCREIELLEPD